MKKRDEVKEAAQPETGGELHIIAADAWRLTKATLRLGFPIRAPRIPPHLTLSVLDIRHDNNRRVSSLSHCTRHYAN